jgi:hypothetical protein
MKRVHNHGYIFLFSTLLLIFNYENATAGEFIAHNGPDQNQLSLATFDVDVTPPIGYVMPYGTVVKSYDMGLRAKGLVISGSGQPIVIIAVDWIGIGNDGQEEFKRVIADAAGTIPQRVAVHCLHQHDTPRGDVLDDFVLDVLHRLELAVKQSLDQAQPVTHIGLGKAEVYKVGSNRNIYGPDGNFRASRFTATPEADLREEPEGLIDPVLSVISFWNNDKPVAVLNFYATHPQSYYRLGIPNPDYPGIARFMRQLAIPDALQVYFTGAGGNVGAGKYNDGSHENRLILAERLEDAMKRAWNASNLIPISSKSVNWTSDAVVLPCDTLGEPGYGSAFVKRYKAGKTVDIGCLTLGNARVLFLPGEPFVEYQLAAKAMRPDLFVTMAGYGDTGAGYIPTAEAFSKGGYEVKSSKMLPAVEKVLMNEMRKLLK